MTNESYGIGQGMKIIFLLQEEIFHSPKLLDLYHKFILADSI